MSSLVSIPPPPPAPRPLSLICVCTHTLSRGRYNGNEWWTVSLGLKEVGAWRAWSLDKQLAGYVTSYEQDFTFLTVKGSGHMVPQYRPAPAFAMFDRMINNRPF